jgi:putative ABC transport system permease protein
MMQDLRFALRSFARTPRFTIPAVLALALGIGATSAIFSVIQAVVLKPLPYRDPDRIVSVWESNAKRNRSRNVIAPANFVEWRARTKSLEHLGSVGPARLTVVLNGQPEEIPGWNASADVFSALGVEAALGRTYTPDEDVEGNDLVIVVSHEFWQSRLGAQPGIVGTAINANGRARTIVGVMPPGFTLLGERANFLIPYGWTLERLRTAPGRGSSFGIARLRDGVSFDQASADMKGIATQLEEEAPQRNTGWSVTLVPVHEQMVEQIRPALRVLAGAVALVLLIACVNVANLLLARSTIRQREMGVRAALGANRSRLVRQMLSESLLLGALGGTAGLLLAYIFHRGLLTLVADRIPVPRIDQVALDLPVLAFTVVLSLLTGLAFGAIPAAMASRTINETLREGMRAGTSVRSRRALGALVVVEVAVSLVLLAGAGLLIRSFTRLQGVDPGFRAEGLLTARVQLPSTRYDDGRKAADFYARALERIAVLPGVRDAAGITFPPLAGPGIGTSFYRADQAVPSAGQAPTGEVRPVTPNFFKTMGIPHQSGRDFSWTDQADSPAVAIVSETLVKTQFDGESPLGRRIHVSIGPPPGRQFEIVGVVADIKMTSLDREPRPAVYLPHPQLPLGLMTLLVRTDLEPHSLVSAVASAVRSIDSGVPLGDVKSMDEVVDATLARPRVVAVLLTAFAAIALVLAGVGVYGVMAYSVAHRTQEIGVRMALGATPGAVFRLVLLQALRLIAIGVGIGLVAARVLTGALDTLLYNTDAFDPLTFGLTAVVLIVVGAVACYVPARRGTRVAPTEALRAE